MSSVAVGPGDDVEAWCTRCRMNLNHRIIATVGKDVRTVHCLTCGGDHRFHPPKHEKTLDRKPGRVRSDEAEKTRKTGEKAAGRSVGEWRTFMKEMPPDVIARLYRASDSYEPDEYIEHPVFGPGRIIDIVGLGKIQVIFKEGRKILICNKRKKP